MSTTIFYHAFVGRGHRHVRFRNDGGVMHWHIERSPEKLRCAACQCTDVIRRGGKIRSLQLQPASALDRGSRPRYNPQRGASGAAHDGPSAGERGPRVLIFHFHKAGYLDG